MKISLSRTVLLSTLLLVPPASRVRADGDPPTPPAPPQAATAPEAPEAPVPPAPPAPPARRKKRVIVTAPEKEIVVDGDRVFVWNDEDAPEAFADMDGMERMELDGPQTFLRHHGGMGGGFIGMRPIAMTPELRQHFGAPKDAGILVGSVEPDGPAAKAGIQVGDIVTRVDGDRIDSVLGLVRAVRHKKEGEKVTVELLRDRAAKSLTVVVVERKSKEIRVGAFEEGMPGMRWKSRGPYAFVPPPPSDMSGLEQRLDEMEQRLRELEGRKTGQ